MALTGAARVAWLRDRAEALKAEWELVKAQLEIERELAAAQQRLAGAQEGYTTTAAAVAAKRQPVPGEPA